MTTPQEPQWLTAWKASAQPTDTQRTSAGTFAKGTSGNPAGKPLGAKSRRTLLAEAFDEGVDDIIAMVKKKALAGDLQAAGLVLARAVPPKRPVSERTPFALDVTMPLAQQAAQVAQAVADGHIAADDALTVLTCLDRVASLRHADTIEERLAALERAAHLRDRTRVAAGGVVIEQGVPAR